MALSVDRIHIIQQIPPEPPGADQVWWRVEYDDGTVPGWLKVYMPSEDHDRLLAVGDDVGDEYAWIREQLVDSVKDLPIYDQGAELRRLSPLELTFARGAC